MPERDRSALLQETAMRLFVEYSRHLTAVLTSEQKKRYDEIVEAEKGAPVEGPLYLLVMAARNAWRDAEFFVQAQYGIVHWADPSVSVSRCAEGYGAEKVYWTEDVAAVNCNTCLERARIAGVSR